MVVPINVPHQRTYVGLSFDHYWTALNIHDFLALFDAECVEQKKEKKNSSFVRLAKKRIFLKTQWTNIPDVAGLRDNLSFRAQNLF